MNAAQQPEQQVLEFYVACADLDLSPSLEFYAAGADLDFAVAIRLDSK